ncbi:formimidoylglutamase [Alteromonas sp. CYL-A6]|uniref:formimidoylglutamase n=1 Tax=Alteromonas nitratireducens TaxID=3390813 RepID=UPI0034BB2119
MSLNELWQGRTDSEDGVAGHRWHQRVVFDDNVEAGDTVIVGYPNDSGVAANKGRTGASGGPNALRQAMAPLPFTLTGALRDTGDSELHPALPLTQRAYRDKAAPYLRAGGHVLGLGGGHDIAWASWQSLHQAFGDARIGIINLDAHLDLRRCDEVTSSGTPFRQIAEYSQQHGMDFHYACLGVSAASNTPALFDYAAKTNTIIVQDIAFSASQCAQAVMPLLEAVDTLYVTICMDAFPAASAPGVSAPAAIGISPAESIAFLRWLSDETRQRQVSWCLSDIAELNPVFDKQAKTARLAARMAFELAHAMHG